MVVIEMIDRDNDGIKMGAIKFGWVSPRQSREKNELWVLSVSRRL